MSKSYDNIIIGSGITGLTIAKLLNNRNEDYLIIDKNKSVGGKLSTENHLGYELDCGFQILLEDYPNLKIFPEIYNLESKRLSSGFITIKQENLYKILNPFKNIKGLSPANTFPGFTLRDKYLLLKLIVLNKKYKNKKMPVKDFLKNFGFSNTFINNFFVSFFQGVFLSKDLNVPLKYFLFIFSLFSKSNVSIPINGINQIAKNIASLLDSSKIIFNKEIINIGINSIKTKDGENYNFKNLYCTDPKIEKLINKELNQEFFKDITYNGTQCFYFISDMVDINEDFIYLFPDSNNITNIYFKKASQNELLVSVSSLSMEVSKNTIEKEILSYFSSMKNIRFLNSYKIPDALPSNSKFFNFQEKSFYKYNNNIYFAGDYLSSPCLDGAIQSGINLVESLRK